MRRKIAGAAMIAAFLVTPLRAEQHLLDVTIPDTAPQESGGEGCAIGESGKKDSVLPLELSLRLDRGSYFLGSEFLFDATLKNTGTRSVTLPWARARVRAWSSKLEAVLSLFTTDDSGQSQHLFGTMIYGDTRAPETLLVLQPGETARIHVPGVVIVPQRNAIRVASVYGTEREIRARMTVSTMACEWSAPILSEPVRMILLRNS